jgi:hypothetical protein
MSETFTEVTVEPEIPANLIQEKDLEILDRFLAHEEVDYQNGEKGLYFYSENYTEIVFSEDGKGEQSDEDVMIKIFQNIIKRSKGDLEYVYLHAACTCSKMWSDTFGGWVLFIRKNSVDRFSTWEAIDKFKKKEMI